MNVAGNSDLLMWQQICVAIIVRLRREEAQTEQTTRRSSYVYIRYILRTFYGDFNMSQ